MNVDTEKHFQDLFFKTLQDKRCRVSESNAERGRPSCPVPVWVKMLSADRERESGSRRSLADLAFTSVHHPGVRQSLVHLRDEDGVTTLHLEPQSLWASCFWVLLDRGPNQELNSAERFSAVGRNVSFQSGNIILCKPTLGATMLPKIIQASWGSFVIIPREW